MAGATANDPINGWRWIFRTQLVLSAIIFIGFATIYRVSADHPGITAIPADQEWPNL